MGGKTSLAPEAEGLNLKTLFSRTLTDICLNNQYTIQNLKHYRRFGKYSCVFSVAPLCIVKLPPTPTKSTDINNSLLLFPSEGSALGPKIALEKYN